MWTTFLENIAIYASAGMIPDTEDQTHFYIARVKPEKNNPDTDYTCTCID